jgi:hypothetical protein
VRDHTKEAYLLTYNVMKGVALANAAYTLSHMITDGVHWSAYILWCASLSALLVSHSTTMTGILLSTSRRNPLDSILPFALSVAEFLLFSTLFTPGPKFGDVSPVWRVWYTTYGAWSLTACFLILNRVLQTKISDVDPQDRPLLELMSSFRKTLWANFCAAGVLGGVWLVVGVLLKRLPLIAPKVHGFLGGFVLLTMAGVLMKNEFDHRSILAVATGERDDPRGEYPSARPFQRTTDATAEGKTRWARCNANLEEEKAMARGHQGSAGSMVALLGAVAGLIAASITAPKNRR